MARPGTDDSKRGRILIATTSTDDWHKYYYLVMHGKILGTRVGTDNLELGRILIAATNSNRWNEY